MLVTGVTSGLGKFLHRHFACDGWQRDQPLPGGYHDTVVHCAHDRDDPSADEDMLLRLLSVPCGKFVFVSSVDVHGDTEYGRAKLRGEQFVRATFPDHLVLRCGALLGRDARPNTLTKMLRGTRLSVTADSTFGYVHHASLLAHLGGGGTVTISGNPMTVRDIAEEFGLSPEYGEFPYRTPPVGPTHDTLTEIRKFLHDPAPDQGPAAQR